MRRYWLTTELREMERLYAATSNADLAAHFGRKPKAIGLMALKLGLRKTTEFMRTHRGFKRGHKTWNAGKSWNPPGAQPTQFKKGQRGPRQRAVGDERLTRDGIEVKVAEPNVWVSKARFVYEQHFGSIPRDMVVRLKDGEKRNFAPSNLILISRAENARLNTIKRKPRRPKAAGWISPISSMLCQRAWAAV